MDPFQRFFDEHHRTVWRFLVARVGRHDADDVFQETFMAALAAYPTLRGDGRSWVMTIAHRKAVDHLRATARRATPVHELPDTPIRDPEPPDEALWAQVRALPEKQRAAVTLRFAADLPHAEVARALGCSEDAARRSLHEGLARLRREVAA